ncbi:HNH endonuclease [Gammaproteobacteria bacterium]|nr:HNH endonuclease [Gammaproteobacteria bacterium]
MHKEHSNFNGKYLQGLSSPQGASDPVQMGIGNLLPSPSSHSTSHPSFFLDEEWRDEEITLLSREIVTQDIDKSVDRLTDKLNKLNNFLSFYISTKSKSKDSIKNMLNYLIKYDKEKAIFNDSTEELCNVIELFLDSQYANSTPLNSDGVNSIKEGNQLIKEHFFRERDLKIIKAKKTQVLTHSGALKCEACNFDYSSTYGTRGHNYIEVHHKKPISEYKAGDITKLSDLAVLCSSCHRMIHRCHPWLTITELKNIINKRAVA